VARGKFLFQDAELRHLPLRWLECAGLAFNRGIVRRLSTTKVWKLLAATGKVGKEIASVFIKS